MKTSVHIDSYCLLKNTKARLCTASRGGDIYFVTVRSFAPKIPPLTEETVLLSVWSLEQYRSDNVTDICTK